MIYKILLFVSVIFSACAQIALKLGMNNLGVIKINADILGNLKRMSLNPMLWLAILFYAIGFIIYAIVLSKMDLSRSYPIALLAAIVIISVVSIIFFNETVSTYKIIGLILCIGGVIFLTL